MTIQFFTCYNCRNDFTKSKLSEFDNRDLCYRCMFTEQREEQERVEVIDHRLFQPENKRGPLK